MKSPWIQNLIEEISSSLPECLKTLFEDVENITNEEIKCLDDSPPTDGPDRSDLPDKIEIIEENLMLIIKRLKDCEDSKQRFILEYPKWEIARSKNTESLGCIGQSLHNFRKTCNITRLVGTCTSFVGGGICIASTALAPVTLGLTTPIAITGGAITVLGSAASAGASITEIAHLKSKVEEAKDILDQDKKSLAVLRSWLTHATDLSEAIERILAIDVDKGIEEVLKMLRDFVEAIFICKKETDRKTKIKKTMKSVIEKLPREFIHMTLTSNLVSLLLIIAILFHRNNGLFKDATNTLKVVANVVSVVDLSVGIFQSASAFIKTDITIASSVSKTVAKTAVALFGMSLDVASIVLTSVDLHDGSVSVEGQAISETADKLKQESKILETVYNKLTHS